MDESLHERLGTIERRQRLVVALLVVPYVVGIAELLGYWVAAALSAVAGLAALAAGVVSRRRERETAES
jgi:hypothetical protein